ncbi:MAG: FliH/SctL family protein [Holophaga sp.]|nr:FliH/SctL family protein [Holophaga sp.]
MSPEFERIIPAHRAELREVESFPYFAATYSIPAPDETDDPEDDSPVAANLSSPAEDAQRLASVDQIIHEKLQIAEQQGHEIARHAYEEGFASGEVEGRSFGESQFKVYLGRLDAHLVELSQMGALLSQASKDEVIALALVIGEYLAGQQIQQSAETIRPLLDSVLESHPFPTPQVSGRDTAALEIFMSPKDLQQLRAESREYPGIRLLEDENLSRGSLRMVSPEGVLEATLERRRERLMEVLHRFREEGTP